jgi:hypothetical protein
LFTIVTRPPRVTVTLDGVTRPSVPIVIVAESVAVPPPVVGGLVVPPPPVDGLVGVELPPPHAAAVAATSTAAASPFQIGLVIRRTSLKD